MSNCGKVSIIYAKMAKDSVCKINVDESNTQYISEINGQKVFLS
jgi:YHS domain-containing protein